MIQVIALARGSAAGDARRSIGCRQLDRGGHPSFDDGPSIRNRRLRDIALIAEHLAQQPVPQAGDLARPDRGCWTLGKAEARQCRYHDIDPVVGPPAEALGMCEALDQVQELDDRPRPAMRQYQGCVARAGAALVQLMDVLSVYPRAIICGRRLIATSCARQSNWLTQ